MGGTTPRYALRYPTLSDPADILQVKSLADDVEALGTKLDKTVGIRTALSVNVDYPGGGIPGWAIQATWGGVTCDGVRLVAPVAGVYRVSTRLAFARLTESPPWQHVTFGLFDQGGVQLGRVEQQVPFLDWTPHNIFTFELSELMAMNAGQSVLVGCVFSGRILAGTPSPVSTFSMFKTGSIT